MRCVLNTCVVTRADPPRMRTCGRGWCGSEALAGEVIGSVGGLIDAVIGTGGHFGRDARHPRSRTVG